VSELELFLVFLKAVLLSSGGLQALPILLDDLTVQRSILTHGDFATAVAVGRIAPGPNGLFVISIGYYIAGLAGALIGAIALMIPPMLAIGLVHAHRRLANRPWVEGMTRGIAASAVALLAALGYSFTVPLLAQPASVGILIAALVVLIAARMDALVVLGGGALVAVALYLMGVPLA
jgi:chromate transporter